MIHAELSVYPIGTGSTSSSGFISKVIIEIQKIPDLRVQTTPMGTLLEASDIETIFLASNVARKTIHELGVKRVEIILKIDSRTDFETTFEKKMESLNEKMESENFQKKLN